ncbi:MAG: cache domain-containing protein [Acidobacteriota bacterium]
MFTRFHAALVASAAAACSSSAPRAPAAPAETSRYEYRETRELVARVDDAAVLIAMRGKAAFRELRVPGSRWRQGDAYVFVLDPLGNMLVHPDPALEGKNQRALLDVHHRPIITGLIEAATAVPGKPAGWYHYEWPVPGGLLPRWKSSYVRLVTGPGGARYIVGSGMYDDRMERAFVVDMVNSAVGALEQRGEAAFAALRDRTGPFVAKDAYVFVIDPDGVELVNPAFPNLEGRDLIDARDSVGTPLVRDMLRVVRTRGEGWVEYMWPRPGDSVSTVKSTYVRRAQVAGRSLLVGCGVYLADAPRARPATTQLAAGELVGLVRDAARVFEERGDDAYPEFRSRGGYWFRNGTYFFVWRMDGTRTFHAADRRLEGKSGLDAKDSLGKPYGRMFLDVAASPSGEGWVHYMYPEPGSMFPQWKSTFIKRVRFPGGEDRLIGAGVYHMQLDRSFIEDVVDRAASLVAERGRDAFDVLRDPTGPFVFMDTYVFVDTPDGTELVNPAQPSLEGTNVLALRDVHGKPVAREYITRAAERGSGWVEYEWYKPGGNTPAHKQAYVRAVHHGDETFVVGSGLYVE